MLSTSSLLVIGTFVVSPTATGQPQGELDALRQALEDCQSGGSCVEFERAFDRCVDEKLGCADVHRAMGYPEKAIQDCVEGTVQLELVAGDGDKIADVIVVSATPPGYFEEAAKAKVDHMRFGPISPPGSTREFGVDFHFVTSWCEEKQSSPNYALERPRGAAD